MSIETEDRGFRIVVPTKAPTIISGILKKSRTARKDGGAKWWENATSKVLQPVHRKSRSTVFEVGTLIWAKRSDGVWWPAEISILEDTTSSKSKEQNERNVLVRLFGLEEVESQAILTHVALKDILLFDEHKVDLVNQGFVTPAGADKFKEAVAQANNAYGRLSWEMPKSPPRGLKESEMQDSLRKGNKRTSGPGNKLKEKQESADDETSRDMGKPATRKRRREGQELQAEKNLISEEDSIEASPETQAEFSYKRRKLLAAHRGVSKESEEKKDDTNDRVMYDEKTKGDDGYFFECMVCDMGGNLLCCDNCPRTYHLECLDPPLKRAPPGKWKCPTCRENLKFPSSRVSDSRRSRSMRSISETQSRSDVSKESPKDRRGESKRTLPNAVIGGKESPRDKTNEDTESRAAHQKKKKNKRKRDQKELHIDVADIAASIVPLVCAECSVQIDDVRSASKAETLCKQCKISKLETRNCHSREPVAEIMPNTEPEVLEADAPLSLELQDETEESRDCNDTKSISEILEVDRIFGCRIISKAGPSSSMKQSTSAENVRQLGILESPKNSETLTQFDCQDCEKPKDQEGKLDPSSECTKQSSIVENLINDEETADASCVGTMEVEKREDISNADMLGESNSLEYLIGETDDSERKHLPRLDNQPCEEIEYFVKWSGKSHIHNQWLKECDLKVRAKRKLDNYKFKHGSSPVNLVDELWCKPQRIIARRQGWLDIPEVLVKWCGLPYDECTWERLDEPVIKAHQELIEKYDYFENAAMRSDEGMPNEDQKSGEIRTLNEQPDYVKGGSLFPHQIEALNWLRKSWGRKRNVILADEMGLGKTISASAFMCSLYQEFKVSAPSLVLVPLSTMPNWMAEFSLWAPQVNVVEYHGSAKARANIRQYEWHAIGDKRDRGNYKFNVLLTTYEMILADSSQLRSVPWEVLVVDEGHRLKNTESKLVQLLNTFSFSHRVLLTGTPLQNNVGEMHNLLKFLQLNAFPSQDAFEERCNSLSTAEQVEELKKLVAPHMLRRLKKDAMQNIPPKTERVVPVELSSLQAEYYRALLTKNYQVLRQAGKPNQHQSLVNIVVQLRKVCNHPYLIPGTEPETGSPEFLHEMRIKASAKLTLLHAMLKILKEKGHRVLVFSQMTRLLDILEDYLTMEFGSQTFERVDGSVSVSERQAAIARFNQDSSRFVFLLSTRACGLGINLASADTVIIYDSDFNPHADIQAMNRAHRIGQSKRLLVYRLVVRASVEERILQLAKKKLMLDHLFANKSGSQKEVEDILKWGTEELFQGTGQEAINSENATESLTESDGKPKRKSGGLGDVYEDTCHKVGRPTLVWDDAAVARLLDRSDVTSEVAEAEAESDLLGSLKAWDWNDMDTTEDHDANDAISKEKDVESSVNGNTAAVRQSADEDSNWDKLLRIRWEKLQMEEEGALGRGKRMRKSISYKEDFNIAMAEVLNESDKEDIAEPEYTPAGLALKNKQARLRARQKERIAARSDKPEVGDSLTSCQEPQDNIIINNISASENLDGLRASQNSTFLPIHMLRNPRLHSVFSSADTSQWESNRPTDIDDPSVQSGATPGIKVPLISTDANGNSHTVQMKRVNDISTGFSAALSVLSNSSKKDNLLDHGDRSNVNDLKFLGSSLGVQQYPTQSENKADNPFIFPMPQVSGQLTDIVAHQFGNRGNLPTDLNLSMNLGLGIQLKDSFEKLRCSSKKRFDSFNCGEKMINSSTSTNSSIPKIETDLGYGLNMLEPSTLFPRNDKQGKAFPFLPYLGGIEPVTKAEMPATWSEEELDALWSGVRRYGRGNWVSMLQDPKLKFSNFRSPKDLADRWHEEQMKMFDGSFDMLGKPFVRDGNGLSDNTLSIQKNAPSLGLKDVFNSAIRSQTKDMALPKIDIESLYHKGVKGENIDLSGLPPMGVDFKHRLPHFGSATGGVGTNLKDDIARIHFQHKLDLASIGLPTGDKSGVAPSSYRLLSGLKASSQKNPQTPPSFSSYDLLKDSEWRFSNLPLRFEKGNSSGHVEPPLELPKFQNLPDILPQSLQDVSHFKPNVDLLASMKLPEMKGLSLPQVSEPSKSKVLSKSRNKAGESVYNTPVSTEEDHKSSSASTLPHWLREAFKPPPPVERLVFPSTIAAICRSVDLVYTDCKPTLPAWINQSPPPLPPHRKSRKGKKKQNLFPMLSLGNSKFQENSLMSLDAKNLPPLLQNGLNGLTIPSFPWPFDQSFDYRDRGNAGANGAELPSHFPILNNISACVSSQSLIVPPLSSTLLPTNQSGSSDAAFSSLFSSEKKQTDFQKRWPFLVEDSDKVQTASHLVPVKVEPNGPDPQKSDINLPMEGIVSKHNVESSNKIQSEPHLKITTDGPKSGTDDTSEETVSDGKTKEG